MNYKSKSLFRHQCVNVYAWANGTVTGKRLGPSKKCLLPFVFAVVAGLFKIF